MGDLDGNLLLERKVEDFYFEQLKKLQIFKSPEGLPLPKTRLLAVSNKFGLCFIGCPTGFRIIKTDTIGRVNKEDERRINAIVSVYPSLYINIGHPVRHVAISCDNITLSVCYEQDNNIMVRVYDIPSICFPDGSQKMLGDVVLSTDVGISLVNLLWNPAAHSLFATCFSNGSVVMWEITDTKIHKIGILPVTTRATAICWSPKGKQMVVGHKDGHLTQYTPLFEVKKETPSPEIFKDDPHQVSSICWISAAVFLNVYTTDDEGDVPQCVLVQNATKTNPKQQMINFDDVYFGMNEDREKGFYTTHLQEWNVSVSVSCNAFEIAVFGNEERWEKWTFEEEKRAEMPLNSEKEETYPMGMAIDLTSTIPIVENERSYPPAPLLLLLSTDGLLCPFYMINKNPKARHDIVKRAEPLPPPGQRSKITGTTPAQTKAPQYQGVQQPSLVPPVKAASSTGPTQPATQPSFFTPNTNTNIPFSFKPSLPSFNTTPAKPTTTESKAPDGVGMSSSKPLFPPFGLFPNSSGSTVHPGSGLTVCPTDLMPPGPASTGPLQQPQSQQQPTLKPNFQNLFSPRQPSTAAGLDQSTSKLVLKPVATTQAAAVSSDIRFRPNPVPQQLEQENQQLQLKKQEMQVLQQQQQQQQLLMKKQLEMQQPQHRQQRQQQMDKQQGFKEQQQHEQLEMDKELEIQQIQQRQQQRQQQLEVQRPRQHKIEQQQAAQQQQLRLQQQQAKQSTTQQNLELSVSKCIFEEIQLFSKELNKLGKDVQQVKEVCSEFLQPDELEQLRKDTDKEAKTCYDYKQVTKGHNSEIQEGKKKLLSSFEVLEDARVRHHRAKDKRYLHLLKSRGLDPLNANKMRIIRELYMYLDKTLGEVNLALDEEWNKENESQKKLKKPTMDAVYRTLRAHHMVAQDQSNKLDKMAEKMKHKKLLSPSWNMSSASNIGSRENMNGLSYFEGSNKSLALETTPQSPVKILDNIPANKSAQLINMMRKRQTTPIRRSMIVSPDTLHARQIQRRKAEPITTLSPPICEDPIVAETPSTRSTRETNLLFSSTPVENSIKERALSDFQRHGIYTHENAYQNNPLSTSHSTSKTDNYPQGFACSTQRTEQKLFKKDTSHQVMVTPETQSPQMTECQLLLEKSPPQSSGTPPLGSETNTGATNQTTRPKLFDTVAPSSSDKGSMSASSNTKEAPLKMTSAFSEEKTASLNQIAPRASPAALAAISRAEKTPVEQSCLDASASIEPRSMFTYGQSGSERQRDNVSETIAAKTIAEEALKRSQLEARIAGAKPQSSTEFSIKATENPKPGPPVVTVKPLSSKNMIPAPNVTVKPVAVPAMPLARPSNVPAVTNPQSLIFSKPETSSFQVSAGSSTTAFSGFSTGALKDTQPPKNVIGLQTSAQNPISSPFASTSNAMKETETTTTSSFLNVGNVQLKSSSLTSGIVNPSPGVSRKLFKDRSNQVNETNDQKEQPADLQTSSESGASSSGPSLGFQLGLDKENVSFGSPTSVKPNTELSSFESKQSQFSFPTTGPPSVLTSSLGKVDTISESSSVVKPFSDGSSTASGFSLPSSTKSSNVFKPFASIPTTLSSYQSGNKPDTSLTSSTTTPPPSPPPPILTTREGTSQKGLVDITTTYSQEELSQGGLFGVTTTASQGGTPQGRLFGVTTTASQGGTLQGGLFGVTTTASQEEPSTGGLFNVATTASQEEPSKGRLFGVTTTASQGGTSQEELFGVTTTASQEEPFQGGLFGSSLDGTTLGPTSTTTLFSSTSTFTSSGFDQPSFSQTAFGQPTTTTSTSVPSSAFSGQSAFSKPQETTSTGVELGFGGFGLGGQPSQLADKNPLFASSSSIPSSGSPLFGGNTSSTGSQPTFASGSPSTFVSQSSSGFGGGSFSRGAGNVASSGFGLGGTGTSGFGSSLSFGGAASFGAGSSFGTAAPAFGSAPVFGSAPQMTSTGGSFGSSTTSAGFGSVSGGPIFGARQPTASSFGNMAQQAQGQSSFGGGFGQQNSSFGQQTSSFGQPTSGFGQQTSSFGQPTSGFGQPTSGFGGGGSPGGGTGTSPGFGAPSVSPTKSFNQWRTT